MKDFKMRLIAAMTKRAVGKCQLWMDCCWWGAPICAPPPSKTSSILRSSGTCLTSPCPARKPAEELLFPELESVSPARDMNVSPVSTHTLWDKLFVIVNLTLANQVCIIKFLCSARSNVSVRAGHAWDSSAAVLGLRMIWNFEAEDVISVQ